jgi:hypothetical protein
VKSENQENNRIGICSTTGFHVVVMCFFEFVDANFVEMKPNT